MELSIVIVNWNGLAVLIDCLASLYRGPKKVGFEVILVDNASKDDSVAKVQAEFPEVIVIQNRENLGFAAANNQAFRIARGKYVLLLNNDTIVLEGALVATVGYLDSHSEAGVAGSRVEFPDRSFQTSCYRFSNLLELFLVRCLPLGSIAQERLNFGRYWGRQFSVPTEVDVVAGCFLMVRREVIESVGGFDEDFFMYGEDEEWCSRIQQAGWKIVYFPGATIIHLHRFSSKQARRALRVIECMSPVLVLHKRRGPVVAWLANVILLAGSLLRFPFWLALDAIHISKGNAQKGLLHSRFVVLAAHFKGLFSAVWLPLSASGAKSSSSAASPLPLH